jgi:phosphatidylglycerophosphate synthase
MRGVIVQRMYVPADALHAPCLFKTRRLPLRPAHCNSGGMRCAASACIGFAPAPPSASHSEWQLGLLLGIPLLWIAAFSYYLLRVRSRAPSPPVPRERASPWLPQPLIEFAYWLYRWPVRLFIALGISADTITLCSLLLTAAAAVLIARGHFGSGGWVLLLAFTCDVWDGMVARETGTCSPRGEFIDATADRGSDVLGFCGFIYYYRADDLALLLTLGALLGSSLVSYVRARGEALGISARGGYMRRYERAVWLGGGTVLAPLLTPFLEPGAAHPRYPLLLAVMGLLAFLANLTAALRIRYVLRAMR